MSTYTSRDVVFKLLRAPESGSWADGTWDGIVDQCIATAGELIDQICGGPFLRAAAEGTARQVRATGDKLLLTPKYVDTPTVARLNADGSVTDLDSQRWSIGIIGEGDWPNRHIRAERSPWIRGATYQITARWGWNQLPASVAQAAAMMAARLFKRIDSPLGIIETGTGPAYVARYDADVAMMLDQFRGANGY